MIDVRPATLARTDQHNAEDFGEAKTFTIGKVSVVAGEQPVTIGLRETPEKHYRPCKTMTRVLVAMWGHDGEAWIGQRITLYVDPEVRFGSDRTGGLRISHASIPKKIVAQVKTTRGKRGTWTVLPLADAATTTTTGPDDLAVLLTEYAIEPERLRAWVATQPDAPKGRAKLAAWLREDLSRIEAIMEQK